MGSVKKHRRANSDNDSYQYAFRPYDEDGSGDAMTFGTPPYGPYDPNGVYDVFANLDYCEPEYFYPNIETHEFKGPYKI